MSHISGRAAISLCSLHRAFSFLRFLQSWQNFCMVWAVVASSSAIHFAISSMRIFAFGNFFTSFIYFSPLFDPKYWLIAAWVVPSFFAASVCVKPYFSVSSFAIRLRKAGSKYFTMSSHGGLILIVDNNSVIT